MEKCAVVSALFAITGALGWAQDRAGMPTFEVASVKPAKTWHLPNFGLNTGNSKPQGGRFSATFPLVAYIVFAYEVPP